MRIRILYQPKSEHASTAERYVIDFQRATGIKPDLINADSPEGSELVRIYDAVQYPAIIVTRDDGQLNKMWQGQPMPLFQEVAAQYRL